MDLVCISFSAKSTFILGLEMSMGRKLTVVSDNLRVQGKEVK